MATLQGELPAQPPPENGGHEEPRRLVFRSPSEMLERVDLYEFVEIDAHWSTRSIYNMVRGAGTHLR